MTLTLFLPDVAERVDASTDYTWTDWQFYVPRIVAERWEELSDESRAVAYLMAVEAMETQQVNAA